MAQPKGRIRVAGVKLVTFHALDEIELTDADRTKVEEDPLGFLREILESHGHKVNRVHGNPSDIRKHFLERVGGKAEARAIGPDGGRLECGWMHEEWPSHSGWSWECWIASWMTA